MTLEMERLCYRVSEVASILSLSRETVRRLISQGKLPHIRVGKSILVPAEALRKLITPTPEGPVEP